MFGVPRGDTIGRQQFVKAFPVFDKGGPAEKAEYVAFTSPDRSRFYQQYGFGLRYTQLRGERGKEMPASVAASVGGHELISGPSSLDSRVRFHGVVGNFEAFFPFNIGGAPAYLFGRALMAFSRNRNTTPLFLEPAIANDKPVPATNAGVYVIASPSDRDVYTVGIGLDPVHLIEGWLKKKDEEKK